MQVLHLLLMVSLHTAAICSPVRANRLVTIRMVFIVIRQVAGKSPKKDARVGSAIIVKLWSKSMPQQTSKTNLGSLLKKMRDLNLGLTVCFVVVLQNLLQQFYQIKSMRLRLG